MRVVFMGTPDFAVPSLRALADGHDVVAVYTRPDAVSGRGRSARPSPVKTAAAELGVPVMQPPTLREAAVHEELRALAPDAIVVAAYGLILPREVLDIPPHGCVNVHGSLLPRWRGAAPVQRAILAGDNVTGVSIMRMEEGLDTGPYCVVRQTDVAAKSAPELTTELALLGADALVEALELIASGCAVWVAQDDQGATYADKISKADVALSPLLSAADATRRVRASSPQAPSRLSIAGKTITALMVAPSDADLPRGAVACTKTALILGFADGALAFERIKPEGKGEMAGCDFARGLRLDADTQWEAAS